MRNMRSVDADSAAIAEIIRYVASRSGSNLSAVQQDRLRRAISKRLAKESDEALLAELRAPGGARALLELMSATAVHKTDLFRDEEQLSSIQTDILRPMIHQKREIQIWSAGCATGEEVATMLVLLGELGVHSGSCVIGTDLSENALATARLFQFSSEAMRRVPSPLIHRWFRPIGSRWALDDELRGRARFVQHNLVDRPFPNGQGGAPFDLILCRNVLIYFSEEATISVLDGFSRALRDGGVLIQAATEPILRSVSGLEVRKFGAAYAYVKTPRTLLETSAASPAVFPAALNGVPSPIPALPDDEGVRLFEVVLDWAAEGQSRDDTEAGLRKVTCLAPNLAAARYMLGRLLEHRGAMADAAREYQRAHVLLVNGTAIDCAFFMNNERLVDACRNALARLGEVP
jgi:chemotaxis protein methyltransferase CheR